ncbi:endonuclease III homolog 1 [[Candida] jaroonii]|uniref:Endonuclease III homolog 1 n=1 Tax=[Candida] jaroonii TaxID=467808 RepID=A0ACA9Y1A8_9ASCO|nr:endonuclease III homolog 1 [[Candida] jaroonii]
MKRRQVKVFKVVKKPRTFHGDIEETPYKYASVKDVNDRQPKNWSSIYNGIVEMRKLFKCPVDMMGCESIPNTITPNLSVNDPQRYRFQLLLSLMLSSQTKDEINYEAMLKLNNELKGTKGLTIDGILSLEDARLNELIFQVGFHNRKTGYIKKACEILKAQYDNDIPKTIEEIVKLPGVGPKMGYLLLQKGWNKNDGIGVDVHLHRLAIMWGWVKNSSNPEVTRAQLQDWLPKEHWGDVNPLLVGFGQVICTPQFKNCDICLLGRDKICKARNQKMINQPLSEKRIEKLQSSRGELNQLIDFIQSRENKNEDDKEQDIKVEIKEEIKTEIKAETIENSIKVERTEQIQTRTRKSRHKIKLESSDTLNSEANIKVEG